MEENRQDEILTLGDLAAYLKVHQSTIYRLLKKGALPCFKVGRDWRFNREQIDDWRHQGGTLITGTQAVGRRAAAAGNGAAAK